MYADSHIHFAGRLFPNSLLKIFGARPIRRLLDMGCGDGAVLSDFQKNKNLRKTSLYGIDIDKKRVERAIYNVPEAIIQQSSAELTPFKDSFFDFIFSWMVIEHVDNDQEMMNEIKRILSKKGKVFLATILKKPWGIYFYRNESGFILDPTHKREYPSKEQLLELFYKSGLKVEGVWIQQNSYSFVDIILQILTKLKILKPSRSQLLMISNNPFLTWMHHHIRLPVPGYFQLMVLASK